MEGNGTNGATNGANGDAGGAGDLGGLKPIVRIEGNLKTHTPYRYDLTAPCVAFVGRNRQGKTAALDTVRLALTGRHPCGDKAKSLAQLVPDGADVIARVTLADGSHAAFHAAQDRGKLKVPDKPVRSGMLALIEAKEEAGEASSVDIWERVLPIESMRSLVRLGSTLGREAIFRRFGHCDRLPVPMGLLPEQQALWDRGVAAVRADLGTKADHADVLTEVAGWFRRHKLELGRKKRTLESSIDATRESLATAGAGAEELPILRRQLAAANQWEQTRTLRARREELQRALEVLTEEWKPFEAWQARASERAEIRGQERAAAQTAISFERGRLVLREKELDEQLENLHGGQWFLKNLDRVDVDDDGHGPCLMCGHSFDPVAIRDQAAPRVAERQAQVAAKQAQVEAQKNLIRHLEAKMVTVEGEWTKTDFDWAQKAQKVELNIRRTEAGLEENARVLGDAPRTYEGPSTSELRARVTHLESVERLHQGVENDARTLREYALEEQQSKLLEQAAAAQLAELLRRTSETANAAVNKYMPEGFRAALDLEDARWTVIGSDGRGHKLKVMSGAECGALIPSLACAWTEGALGRYVLLDDEDFAGFDEDNLKLLLEALKDCVEAGLLTQVFIAWSRPKEIPAGWGQTILIDREAAQADAAQLKLGLAAVVTDPVTQPAFVLPAPAPAAPVETASKPGKDLLL